MSKKYCFVSLVAAFGFLPLCALSSTSLTQAPSEEPSSLYAIFGLVCVASLVIFGFLIFRLRVYKNRARQYGKFKSVIANTGKIYQWNLNLKSNEMVAEQAFFATFGLGSQKTIHFSIYEKCLKSQDLAKLHASIADIRQNPSLTRDIEVDFYTSPDSLVRSRLHLSALDPRAKNLTISCIQEDIQKQALIEEALKNNFMLLSAQRGAMPDASLVLDKQGTILDLNDHFYELWDLEAHELRLGDNFYHHHLLGNRFKILIHPKDTALFNSFVSSPDHSSSKELSLRLNDGRAIEITRGPLVHEGHNSGTIFFFKNASSHNYTLHRLDRTQYALDHLQAPIEWFNKKGQIIYTNDLALAFFSSYYDESLVGKKLWDIHPHFKEAEFDSLWSRLEQEKSIALEFENQGNTYECFMNYFKDETEEYCFNYIRDITLKKRQNQELLKMAYYDQITGLHNLRGFARSLDEYLSGPSQKTIAVALIDIDHFKTINDVFHHRVGDELLKLVGERIHSLIGNSLPLSRIAGDEFVFALDVSGNFAALKQKIEEIHQALNIPYFLRGQEFMITSSFGIALYPHDAESWDDLYSFADIAMYKAKQGGRNQVSYFNLEMKEALLRSHQVSLHLNHALERDELYLVHQAQIRLSDNRLLGFETLIRWRSKDLGMVSPQYFIGIAESNGLIVSIGEWALKKSCQHAVSFNRQFNTNLGVSVNVSALQFKVPHFAQKILSILEETGLDPKLLELEITESVIINDIEVVIDILRELRTYGIRIAVDDFGTGYSSLHYLQKLPLDKLKIDKGFIDTMLNDSEAQTVVKIILDLSKRLKLKVVAEGVESVEQLDFLKSQDCDLVQGFYYTSALDYDAFNKFLINYEAEQGELGHDEKIPAMD